eukprot:747627-Hanusia_phi.AAC.4
MLLFAQLEHVGLTGAARFIGAVCFYGLNYMREKTSLSHAVTFLLTCSGAIAYYSMWSGLGVTYKTTDTTPRVIFWGRYLGHLITYPLVLVDISIVFKLDNAQMIALVGYDLVMFMSGWIGSVSVGSHKYMWWFLSFIFAVLVIVQLASILSSEYATDNSKVAPERCTCDLSLASRC